MAATPPRPAIVVPKSGHTLQISPNLEALLEHDELIRRNSASDSPVGLPPPPPRNMHVFRRAAGQDTATRSKDEKRKRTAVAGSDCWPDALSRSVTPSNPYLNPTPVLQPVIPDDTTPPHSDVDDPGPTEYDESRPNKILWMSRDSLSLFSGSRRNDYDGAVQGTPRADLCVERPPRCVEYDTATVQPSSRPDSSLSFLHSLRQLEPTLDTDSAHAHSESHPTKQPSPAYPHPAAFLPRLSLPSIFMSHHSPPSRPRPVDHDHLSFIDFFSPSTSEDPTSCIVKDDPHQTPLSRRHRRLESISIPSPSLSRCNSSASLSSMKFAPPPSPTSIIPPAYCRSDSAVSSITLSSMKFAPPSPSSECLPPTRLQPLSESPSPCSPLEFATPPSPLYQIVEKPASPPPGFTSERGRKLTSEKRSMSSSPRAPYHPRSFLPPTTNQLDANERADRIRRNRKLARVFGQTPGTDEPAQSPEEPRPSKKLHSPSLAALLTKQKNHRHAVSVTVSVKTPELKTEPSTPWQTDGLWTPGGRRHSTPLAGAFTLYVGDGDEAAVQSPLGSFRRVESPDAASARSFIDLSDEDGRDDVSCISFLAPPHYIRRRLHHSTSFPSLVESLDSEAQAEVEKRRKREKLARLHRFLGSRVPPEAVNGLAVGPPLPPPAAAEHTQHEHRFRGRKSASLDEFDRGKEELDYREKARNVRRAQKMERVFGAAPPQTLFHTRTARPSMTMSPPLSTSPTTCNPYVLTLDLPSARNPNQTAYMGKTVHRSGPSDSSKCLLSRAEDTPQSSPSSFAQSFADSFAEPFQQVLAQSSVYLNYQHSLNSLVDIIDRDDRRSLVELHRFLHGGVAESPSDDDEVPVNARRISNATSLKSERRHSLPSSVSMTSISSEYTCPELSPFQLRRRKAAKLTHFFGVDYRELIVDILESIEKGVEDERKQGTLQPQEVEVLMHRVRSLRSIRSFNNV